MEVAKADGWRYLALKPQEVESLTPREFTILMRAQQERQFDEYERMAFASIMQESATRAKRPKASDLFKRPVDVDAAEKKVEDLLKKSRNASEWMEQFTLFTAERSDEINE
ncbi:hypothetical protein I2483_13600 [Sporosarcina sp. E16_3]|uniref:hypothetical protein n=1 Tax=Sporosarcina sp. E16_3 TaxID=2789293 RepID=UPI001A90EDA3|nr:hypothetical protein [Sporosarcina sp. E16_3]MBO0602697.1 hypothetical protein [Sporosarcina sp. E16_3]